MEANATPHDNHEDQDEFVLLDLDAVYDLIHIPPNANYVLRVTSQSSPHQILYNSYSILSNYHIIVNYRVLIL